jgi:hypothetical protein
MDAMDTIQKLLLVILQSMVKDTDAVELHVSDQSDTTGESDLGERMGADPTSWRTDPPAP